MDSVFWQVAGLDVHLRSVCAAVRSRQQPTGKLLTEVRTFGTMTRDLRALAAYLHNHKVTHVALEATGVLWKPVWNLLDGQFTLLLVNPRHLKKVPGRKTDQSDSQWLAQLLECGLLKGSFVPPREIRELRDLTRQRAQLTSEHTRVANRVHKLLEAANIKLGSVASDLLGKSGRAMLRAMLDGEQDPNKLADLALGRLRDKIPELRLALDGHCTEHHRYLLKRLMGHLNYLETQIADFSDQIRQQLRTQLPEEENERLQRIPGVGRLTVENVIAEIGVEMGVFPDAHQLSSWTGICPGNEESAGKRRRSRIRKGNKWLRRALTEAAWGASRSKNTYFAAQYRRLAARRGKKRALVAVGHRLLGVIYHVLKTGQEYSDLGGDYFDRVEPERLKRHLVRRLEQLGYEVNLARSEPNEPLADDGPEAM